MATVRHIISLLVLLLAVGLLAANAWPLAVWPPRPPVSSLDNREVFHNNGQPISGSADVLPPPSSATANTPDKLGGAANLLSQPETTASRQSSSQINNGNPAQVYSTDSTNHNKPISNSNVVSPQLVPLNRDLQQVLATPSKQNSSELHADKTETDRLDRVEGSGAGPVGFLGKEAKSKLDDTEESDDDDDDYDETLDTGSGHGNLNKPSSRPLPANTLAGSAQGEIRERPQQGDFYKPFRPPPQPQPVVPPTSPSPVLVHENQQKRPNNDAPEIASSSSSAVAAREAPAQVTYTAKNVTTPFASATTPPPSARVPSVIPTLVTPTLSRGESSLAAHNRTQKSEPDYEDEEDNEDDDDGETSAFEDNDTSEADAVGGAPHHPTPNATLPHDLNPAMRPLGKVNHHPSRSGFEPRPLNASAPSSIRPGTLITSPANAPPGPQPPAILTRPMTPPTALPAQPPSVTSNSPSSIDDQLDDGDEGDDVEEDEEEDEEEDDGDSVKDDMDGDDQYPFGNNNNNNTRPATMGQDNRPLLRPQNAIPKPQTVQIVQNQTTTTSAPYPSQYSKSPTVATSTSSPQPPSRLAPVNHEVPHYVTTTTTTTTMPTRLPAAITTPISKLPVPIVVSSRPAPASTSFVPTIHPPPYKPILNAATSVTTGQQPPPSQPPILVPTIQGHQQQIPGQVNPPPPLLPPPPPPATTITPPDKPRSHFTTLDPRPLPSPPPTMQFAPPTNRGGGELVVGQTNRALRGGGGGGGDKSLVPITIAEDDTLTKQIYDKAIEVYHEADKTVRAAWEAVWPPNMNFESASMEPLLTQPLFFMLALGGAIICLVLLMMLVVYIISYQIQPKVDDDISIY